MKIFLSILILIHGIIHLLGFTKAFRPADVSQLTQSISKTGGMFWLATALLFVVSFCLLLLDSPVWWPPAVPALIVSQILILQSWTDAKYGTIANLIITLPVVVAFLGALPSSFQNRYKAEVQRRLVPVPSMPAMTAEDISHLPNVVQRYLSCVGTVGKPRVSNFRAVLGGVMRREKQESWLPISSRQYDFFDDPTRLFYIRSSYFGVPFDGLHSYIGSNATMGIKIAHIFQVADAKGEKMTHGETVTLFNDMCILAPSTLVDSSIKWRELGPLSVEASFTNKRNTITAILSFNEKGELVNFISNDRYLSTDGRTYTNYPWSTPVSHYGDFQGRKVPTYAEAIWHTADGEFLYAKFNLKEIEYDCTEYE